MDGIFKMKGGIAKDQRGQIRFVNEFDMSLVKRFYIIKNDNISLIRGWRAHRIEQRWFYVLSGEFVIDIVKIDNWEMPNPNLPVLRIRLKADKMELLHVPAGYGTAFRAEVADSELLVFADYPISNAPLDDYTWDHNYFKDTNSLQ